MSATADMLDACDDDDEPTELKQNRFHAACRDLLSLADSVPPE